MRTLFDIITCPKAPAPPHEFFRAISAAFTHVVHGLADSTVHPQCFANFDEQRRINGQSNT